MMHQWLATGEIQAKAYSGQRGTRTRKRAVYTTPMRPAHELRRGFCTLVLFMGLERPENLNTKVVHKQGLVTQGEAGLVTQGEEGLVTQGEDGLVTEGEAGLVTQGEAGVVIRERRDW